MSKTNYKPLSMERQVYSLSICFFFVGRTKENAGHFMKEKKKDKNVFFFFFFFYVFFKLLSYTSFAWACMQICVKGYFQFHATIRIKTSGFSWSRPSWLGLADSVLVVSSFYYFLLFFCVKEQDMLYNRKKFTQLDDCL